MVFTLVLGACGGLRKSNGNQEISYARGAFEGGDYEDAAKTYEDLARARKSAALWKRSAEAYIELGRLKAAEMALLESVRLGDRSPRLHELLSATFIESGLTSGRQTKTTTQNHMENPAEYWSRRGRKNLRAKSFQPAARDLAIATSIASERVADWMSLGDAHRGTGDALSAAKAYTEAFLRLKKYGDQDPQARKRRRRMFSSVIRLAAETKAYDLAAQVIGDLVSDWPEALISKFLARAMPPELAPALPLAYSRILSKNPQFMSIRIALLKNHYRHGDWLKVCQLAEPIVGRLVYLPDIMKLASDAAFRAGKNDLALYILGQNRESMPNLVLNTIKLVRGLFRAKRYARARSELLLARRAYPDDVRINYLYACALHETGDSTAALNLIRQNMTGHRTHAPSLNYVGYELARLNKNLEEAESMIRLALQLDPKNPSYLDSLAWVYYRMGRLSKAEGILKDVVAKVPDNGEIFFHLACVLRRMNKHQAAALYFGRALELEKSAKNRSEYKDEWKRITPD
jgi:tetratricopeptide (TPR) repeat protein